MAYTGVSEQSWPNSKNLAHFVDTSAKVVVGEYIGAVYDYIDEHLTEQVEQIKQLREDVQRAVSAASEQIKIFQEENKLDEKFVR